MNLLSPQSVEERIIYLLSQKSVEASALLAEIQKTKVGFTKQALYGVLRKMLKEEIIVKHGKTFTLSHPWIIKMIEFFSLTQKRYGIQQQGIGFLSLQDGDKIKYSFKNPAEADKFWAHAFDVLVEMLDEKDRIYIYNPHDWFLLARQESEVFLYEKLKKQNHQLWVISGYNTPLDKYISRFFDGEYLQYYILTQAHFGKDNYYVNIFGEYLIEAKLDDETVKNINNFYNSYSVWDEKSKKILEDIVEKGRTELSISRNAKKAEKIKKQFQKYFFVIK